MTNNYQNLLFFNSTGDPLNLAWGLTALSYNDPYGTFLMGEWVVGSTSGAQAVIVLDNGKDTMNLSSNPNNNIGTFVVGETITGNMSGVTAVITGISVSDWWIGQVQFDRVSVGLFDQAQIFVLEKVGVGTASTVAGDATLTVAQTGVTFPILGSNPAQVGSPPAGTWDALWQDDEDQYQIYLYSTALAQIPDTAGDPFNETIINQEASASVPVDQLQESQEWTTIVDWEAGSTDEWVSSSPSPTSYSVVNTAGIPTTMRVVRQLNGTALQFNVAFSSTGEGIYQRTLIIQDASLETPITIAEINFYGETVGEDERFRLTLENFGMKFDQKDALILWNYDIMEALPDWLAINEKRKEMLLTINDIFPYVGSYKGLINAINFYGYNTTLTVKEYWQNTDVNSPNYGKFQHIAIEGLLAGTFSPSLNNPLVPTSVWTKTNLFGLYYDITIATGDVDEWGVPITQDASVFTPDEVLVKLFALENKLQTQFLPSNARIVDITGEGIYFGRYNTRDWDDPTTIFNITVNRPVAFTVFPPSPYVRDLRLFEIMQFSPGLDLPVGRFTNSINPYDMGQQYPGYTIPGLVASINEFYDQVDTFPFPYTGEQDTAVFDEPGIPAGCPIVLTAEGETFMWEQMNMTWDSIDLPIYTWGTIDFSNFYEIEWNITLNSGGPTAAAYDFTILGTISDYYQLAHFLPYAGTYTITMSLHDMFGGWSMFVSAITVLSLEVQISAFCRFRLTDNYSWIGTGETWAGADSWDTMGSSMWMFPIEGTNYLSSPVSEQLINWALYRNQEDIQVLSTDGATYDYVTASENPIAARLGTQWLNWNNMDVPWDEMYHAAWNFLDYHGEFIGGFRIFSPSIGDSIQVGDYPPFVFYEASPDVFGLDEACAQLNAARENPGIQLFEYTVVEPPTYSPAVPYIRASAVSAGASGWQFITYHEGNSPSGIYGDGHSFTKPTWLYYTFDKFLAANPQVDPDILFLDDIDFGDLLSGVSDHIQYWAANNCTITYPPTSVFQQYDYSQSFIGHGLDDVTFEGAFYGPPETDPVVFSVTIAGTSNPVLVCYNINGTFDIGETITGVTSGATATIESFSFYGTDIYFVVSSVVGTFSNNEFMNGSVSGSTVQYVSEELLDLFNWAEVGGSAGSGTSVLVSNGGPISLADGISVNFNNITGHTIGNEWTYTIISLGQRDGFLPSWAGTASFTSNDLQIFDNSFQVPIGVPVFFVCQHSEIPGKSNWHWQLTNAVTGELVVDTIGKSSLIFNFDTEGFYSVSLSLTDSNGNPSSGKREGFVQAAARAQMGVVTAP